MRMDYLLDGMEEIVSDEKSMNDRSLDSVAFVVKQALTGIRDHITGYDMMYQRNIMNKVSYILSSNRFACMLVYGRFRTFPGLNDLVFMVSRKLADNVTSGSLNTFYDGFIRNNIDNNLSEGFRRFIMYGLYVIDDVNDMELPNGDIIDHMNLYESLFKFVYSQTSSSYMAELGIVIKEKVIQDLLEYMDMNILGEYDDSLGDKIELLIETTSDMIEDGIENICNNFNQYMGSLLDGNNVRFVDKDRVIESISNGFRAIGRNYINEVKKLTRATDTDDRNAYVNKFGEITTSMFMLSYARNMIVARLKYIKDNIMTDNDIERCKFVREVSFMLIMVK